MKKLLTLLILLFAVNSFAVNSFAADSTINGLPDLGAKPATDDEFVLWDSSTGKTKKVDFSELSDIQNVDEFGGLTAAVASVGAATISLLLDTAQTVTDDLSIPTTMQVIILRSGTVTISAGKVLTINGDIQAPGNHEWALGTGTVTNNMTAWVPGAWTGGTGISADGDVTAATGNVVIGTSGKGIDFSATANAAGMTSELLDDYEEGTWTPVCTTAGATYTTQEGSYTKVGNKVTVQFQFEIALINASSANSMGGLPFTVGTQNTTYQNGNVGRFSTLADTPASVAFMLTPSATTGIWFAQGAFDNTNNASNLLGNGALLIGSATYFID